MHDPEDTMQEKVFHPEEVGEPRLLADDPLYIPGSLDPNWVDYEDDEDDPVRVKAIFAGVCIAFALLFVLFLGVVDKMEQTGYMDDHIRAARGYVSLPEAKAQLAAHQPKAQSAGAQD